jgi:S-(hydroxymethyl)glutathione dehydrogenase/alcohol dehydrogenase
VKGRSQVPQLVDRWLGGDFDAEALVTAQVALEDVNDAFDAMERQEGIRTVITSFA